MGRRGGAGVVPVLRRAQADPRPGAGLQLNIDRRTLLAASAAGLTLSCLLPEAARASSAGGYVEVPLTSGSLRAGALRTGPLTGTTFSALGLTWRGQGRPDVRVRTGRHGRWSPWRTLTVLHDGPDLGTEGRPGLVATHPWWAGDCDAVDVVVRGGPVRDLTLALIDPGGRFQDQKVGRPHTAWLPYTPPGAPKPQLRGRAKWGADESWRDGGPYFNRTIKQVHIHHTATGNDYAPADVPALLRSIYRYHTHTLGWSDIGYNFLVDRFGRTWTGRAGGADKPVRGAHTLGFNNTSTGIAVLGTFTDVAPGEEVVTSLVQLAAWKLDLYKRTPVGTTQVRSQGSDLYADGVRVRLPVIDGHRDTNQTECPGQLLYDLLGSIRERAQQRVDRY